MNLTRRDFAKLSTLALVDRFVQNPPAGTSASRKTGYCVIGLGRIAGHFMPAVRHHHLPDHRARERPSRQGGADCG